MKTQKEIQHLCKTGSREDVTELVRELQDQIKRLTKPKFELADVLLAGSEHGLGQDEAEAMYDHYEMVGWVYGKSRHPIRSLPAAIRNWKRNSRTPVAAPETTPLKWEQFLRQIGYNYTGEYKHAPEFMRTEFQAWRKAAK